MVFDDDENVEADEGHAEATQGPLAPEARVESHAQDVVYQFKNCDKLTSLKLRLQQSFTVQWIMHKLEWPKRFTVEQKRALPLERALMECTRQLRALPSQLKRWSAEDKDYTLSIGKGLFSNIGYRKGDLIAEYVGVWRTQAEYQALCADEPERRAYSLVMSEHSDVLDCYDHYLRGLCLASFANDPTQCRNIVTGAIAKANCRIVANVKKGIICLRAGVVYPNESPANFYIPRDTELVARYGNSFVSFQKR